MFTKWLITFLNKDEMGPGACLACGILVVLFCSQPIPCIALVSVLLTIDLYVLLFKGLYWICSGTRKAVRRKLANRTRRSEQSTPIETADEVRERAIAKARREFRVEARIARAHEDPDEREAFLRGAQVRLREKLARISVQ